MIDRKRPVPRKLNQGMIDALSTAIANGNYATTACQLAGISDKTLWEWMNYAVDDENNGYTEADSLYVKLSNALKKAESQAEADLVRVVREAGTVKREWLPAMTFLERRHPDRWGRRERRDVNIETKTINITRVEVNMPNDSLIIEGEVRELEEGKDAAEQS